LWQSLVARVVFAITNEESRYSLNGAKFIVFGGILKLVATDGHRLAYTEIGEPSGVDIDVLIPKKALIESGKLADSAKEIEIAVAENTIFFRVGNRVLSSRMLTGQFPNYELVLPKANLNVVTVDRAALSAAVLRVSLMADEKSHSTKLTFAENSIQLAAQASDTGEAADTVSCEYHGPEIVAGFNAQYLIEALDGILTASVKICLKDGASAAELGPVGEDNSVQRQILMPMRL